MALFMIYLHLKQGRDALLNRMIFFLSSGVLVVWRIKKVAPKSILPTSDYRKVSAICMPVKRWAIDPAFALRVEQELGIGNLNFYRFTGHLVNKLPY